jgi:hypothetical protein
MTTKLIPTLGTRLAKYVAYYRVSTRGQGESGLGSGGAAGSGGRVRSGAHRSGVYRGGIGQE